jgi:hypothetical protein
MNLTFSAFQIIVNNQKPSLAEFSEVSEEQYNTKDNTYKINIEKLNERFLWIYAIYGGSLPYSEEVVDTKTDQIIDNPRKINHIELNHQLFCIYDSDEYYFYISNSKKKTFLEEYFKQKLSKDFIIKRFFKNPQEFMDEINTIDRISFTSKNNIFTTNSGLFDDVTDIFGLGQPENFKIDINYEGKNKTQKFTEIFKSFLTKNNNREIQSLVCIGKDDNEVESIFDISSFTKTRTLNLKKDEAGMFDPSIVKQNFINQLTGVDDV